MDTGTRLALVFLLFAACFRLALRFAFGLAFGWLFFAGGRRRFARVIGHIPAAALELQRRRRDQLFDLAAALGTIRLGGIEALHALEHMPAFLASVLVDGHISILGCG